MPFSDEESKPYTYELLTRIQPQRVLDIGAGAGVYGRWLRANIDVEYLAAVEIWEPYIQQFGLVDVYDEVWVEDVRNNDCLDQSFDVIIFGDVLEHMTKDEAITLWDNARFWSNHCIISIPTIHYPQGESHGNPYEAHVHDDWSVDEVLETFPGITEHREFSVTSVFWADNTVE